jgi:protease IV
MRNFFKTVFATMLGCFFSFLLLAILLFVFVIGSLSFSGGDKEVHLNEGTILHITMDHPITERATNNPFKELDFISMKPSKSLGINEIVAAIDAAAADEKISAIFIEPSLMFDVGFASLEEIRNALIQFKESGKPVIAYSEVFSQKSYYLASVADKIYLNPQGVFDFRGFASQLYFLKGTLSKLEIQAQIIRHGKYKSAVEPFTVEKMSEANREQYSAFLNSLWGHYLNVISATRTISVDSLNHIADSVLVRNPSDALRFGFVDGLVYKDSILEILKVASASDVRAEDLESVTLYQYAKSTGLKSGSSSKNKIAVIYAVGEIGSGEGDDESIGSERISRTIRKARTDENVKAIVIRVNSPGGSALASEVIWREVKLAAQVKPVVVSMGDLAASGGYYIACAATKIVAQPNTLTGSIGVFGVIMNMGDFFKNKLGVTFDVVKTNEFADMMTTTRALTPFELSVIQQSVEEIYDVFVHRVAEGRNMTVAQVDSIAQGRIWSGIDAKSIGLVDEIGGLEDAIRIASELAGIEEYSVIALPVQKELFDELFSDIMGKKLMMWLAGRFVEQYPFLRSLEPIRSTDAFMTRLPFDLVIE